ncbi:MAG: winged helix DNA-binding domain-containing protein [Candidatus Brocadiae bacterium]|nr:winged helix DNA-binding domain-containing protein [Candidatus Brocadiia bacterium]
MRRVSARDARRLLLGGQGLCEDPARPATDGAVRALLDVLGFVQVDSVRVVERAHHLTLGARLDGYRPAMLDALLERDRAVFEHWTHDASIIPQADRVLRIQSGRLAPVLSEPEAARPPAPSRR